MLLVDDCSVNAAFGRRHSSSPDNLRWSSSSADIEFSRIFFHQDPRGRNSAIYQAAIPTLTNSTSMPLRPFSLLSPHRFGFGGRATLLIRHQHQRRRRLRRRSGRSPSSCYRDFDVMTTILFLGSANGRSFAHSVAATSGLVYRRRTSDGGSTFSMRTFDVDATTTILI